MQKEGESKIYKQSEEVEIDMEMEKGSLNLDLGLLDVLINLNVLS